MRTKVWIYLLLVFPCLTACLNNGQDAEKGLLQMRLDSISRVNDYNERNLNEMSSIITAISDGLDSIAAIEEMIQFNSLGIEGRRLSKTEMRERLDNFAEMLQRQKERIVLLEDSVAKMNSGSVSQYQNLIAFLNNQIEEKDETINTLRKDLNRRTAQVSRLTAKVDTLTETTESLNATVSAQEEALVVQSDMLNEGYVKIGSKKELQNAGLITSGGLFSKSKLNISQIDESQFMKVDIREFNDITIHSKNPKILSQMPNGSYSIVSNGGISTLHILNPTLFWSVSRYLIIQTK